MSKDSKDTKAPAALYHFAFTWNCKDGRDEDAFSKEDLALLLKVLPSRCEHFIFQLERGLDNKRLHYQGYLHANKRVRVAQLAKTLHADGLVGLHLSPSHDHEALKNYCMKRDLTYVAGPWDDRDSNGQGVEVLDEKMMYSWQAEILKQLRADPDDRKVCWLVDQKGNSGKSALAKFLCKHKLALPLTYTDAKDAMYMVTQQAWQRAYVFDLTRCKPAALSASDLYSVMEQIKNGLLQNTKYVAKAGILRKPSHVWVFSNHVPDYKSLSTDRWMVYEINENQNLIGFDKTAFVYASKKRRLRTDMEAAREAKRRKADTDFINKQAAEDDSTDDQAIEAYLGPPPAPSENAEV